MKANTATELPRVASVSGGAGLHHSLGQRRACVNTRGRARPAQRLGTLRHMSILKRRGSLQPSPVLCGAKCHMTACHVVTVSSQPVLNLIMLYLRV